MSSSAWKPPLPEVSAPEMQSSGRETMPSWMITFGDLMSLLLVLFAFLFSLKTLRPAKHISLASGHDGLGLPLVATIGFERDRSVLPDLFAHSADDVPVELEKLHTIMQSLAADSRVLFIGYASPDGAAKAGVSSVRRLELSRAESVSSSLERLLEWKGLCPVLGEECKSHEPKRLEIVHGTGGGRYPPVPGREVEESGKIEHLDRVEICILYAKLGREVSRNAEH